MKVYASRMANLARVLRSLPAHGDATFIVYGDRRITFAEFAADASRIAASLAAAELPTRRPRGRAQPRLSWSGA